VRVLVLGAGGQLGTDLLAALGDAGHEAVGARRAEVDVTDDHQVRSALAGHRPERVVNCAAYTKVDQAESESELAFAINRDGARVVAGACAEAGIPLCHISTDFVFGQAAQDPPRPWRTTDTPRPRGVYAKSKRAGEVACRRAGGDLYLVRTSWLYGNRGPNFPLTILRAAARGRELRVVSDQVGAPTWTGELAPAICWLLTTNHFGIHHLCGRGAASWYELAVATLEEVGLPAQVRAVSTEEWGAAAPRPRYSVLDNSAFIELGGPPLAEWRSGLREYLSRERDGAVRAALTGG
jgi:dTDP-4-dehydrorhamnose reductase